MNQLAARLRERIAASGPISFSAFMQAALYDPDGGFYARGARLGAHGGAFTTAPIAAPFLARALGSDLRGLWQRAGGSRQPLGQRRDQRVLLGPALQLPDP